MARLQSEVGYGQNLAPPKRPTNTQPTVAASPMRKPQPGEVAPAHFDVLRLVVGFCLLSLAVVSVTIRF